MRLCLSLLKSNLNDNRKLPLNKVDVFAKVLHVTPEYLLGFKEEPYKTTMIAAHRDGEVDYLDEDEDGMQKVLECVKLLKSQNK